VFTAYFTGQPIWDKIAKGETLWGSPAVLEAGENTAVIYGSFNDWVYVIPLAKESSLKAMADSTSSLWWSLLAVFVIFFGIILPVVINFRTEKHKSIPVQKSPP
jgi:hypothetical protein